jgi:peptidoglycan/LPS O-acetylase OafA/YrhL
MQRFHSLDALRGIAALAVVVLHWKGFTGRWDAPLDSLLFMAYEHGELAVDLFFCLSGFVFFWLYGRSVSDGTMPAGRFALMRFSRLYPLHLATLILAAAGHWLYTVSTGLTFHGGANTNAGNLLAHLMLANAWAGDLHSFNGPAWSISVEALLYAAFFVFCRHARITAPFLAVVAVLGFWPIHAIDAEVGRGVGSFFMGGLAFVAFRRFGASAEPALRPAMILMWGVALMCSRFDMADQYGASVPQWLVTLALFPLTVLYLAALEAKRGPTLRGLSWLGDISYSVYLLHFPLQLLAASLLPVEAFKSAWIMAGFFAVLIPASLASHHGFERPVQRWLRSRRSMVVAHGQIP